MRQLALKTAVALATLAAVVALWQLRHAALLLLLSITLAASTESLVQALVRRRASRSLAIGLVYGLGLVVGAGAVSVAARAIPDELSQAIGYLQRVYGGLRTVLPVQGALRSLAERLPDPSHLLDGDALGPLGGGAVGLTGSLFSFATEAIIVLVLSLLWTVSAQPFERLWLSLLAGPHRAPARQLWHSLRDGVGLELRSRFIQSFLCAVFMALIFRVLGLSYPILAALSIATLWLIPLVGAPLALAVALLVGASRGLAFSGAACAATIALLVALRLLVAERLIGARRLHPLLVGMVLAALWEGGGLYALLAAGPLAAALAIVGEQLLLPSTERAPEERLSHLAHRLTELEALLERSPVERPRLENVAGRLAELVREAAATET